MSYAVKEIFYTLQGEGARSGRAAVFCRFAGCNLWTGREEDREQAICQFCDTDFVGVDGDGGGHFAGPAELAAAIADKWGQASSLPSAAPNPDMGRRETAGVYDAIRLAPLDQLLRWWEGIDAPPEEYEEEWIDEVAYALSQQGPVGVATLRRYFDSEDVERRSAAVEFCAQRQVVDDDVRGALVRAVAASEAKLKIAALWAFLHLGYFPLPRAEGERLLQSSNELVAAVAMCYLSRAFPAEAIGILRGGLRSGNPRMRECACDEIGDREIGELSEEMRRLVSDADHAVAQAARTNLEVFTDPGPSPTDGRLEAYATTPYVVFTGGEPALQLDAALLDEVHARGLEVAIETNGTRALPPGVDWICVSPKAGAPLQQRRGHELKLVYPQPGAPPEDFAGLEFGHFFLQPMDGQDLRENMRRAVAYCLAHPQWRIGLQTHKILGIA